MWTIKTFALRLATTAATDVLDLTPLLRQEVAGAGIAQGLLTVFTPGSTAAITTIEYESGVIDDLKRAIDRLIPRDLPYAHDRRWGDGNGYAHVRAAFFKPSLSVLIEDCALVLGTWQQIVLLDFDNRPRQRLIRGQILGQAAASA